MNGFNCRAVRIDPAPGNVRAAHAKYVSARNTDKNGSGGSSSRNRSKHTAGNNVNSSSTSQSSPDLKVVYGLVLSPAFRHRGLGAVLLDAAAKAATSSSTTAAHTTSAPPTVVLDQNTQPASYLYLSCCGAALVRFYEQQCGFTRCNSELEEAAQVSPLPASCGEAADVRSQTTAAFPSGFTSDIKSGTDCDGITGTLSAESVVWMCRRLKRQLL